LPLFERIPARLILAAFLRLGCISFGGPVAHLGYFREEFVTRRRWIGEATFAEIVAVAQTLPGPASSQVGFSIGMLKGGWLGALAAWIGFTLPSAVLMFAFALANGAAVSEKAAGLIHGLQLVAVAVIAQAVLSMQQRLAADRMRASIAVLGAVVALLLPPAIGTVAAIAAGGLCGVLFFGQAAIEAESHPFVAGNSKRSGLISLALFATLLFIAPLLAAGSGWAVFDAFYRSGALVFGGGHVVLPLLESATVAKGWIGEQAFLAGYGAAQAIPGPLFTFSAYLGALLKGPVSGAAGASIALAAIFLPGLLLIAGILPFWASIRDKRLVRALLTGVNASVVGVLGAALYSPVWTSTVRRPSDLAIALAAFLLLVKWRLAPWLVVLFTAGASGTVSWRA
jgi:chromate transporter